MALEEIRVPDLEGAQDVGVVEIYVSAGESLEIESPVISLESDKAVMDVPSPLAGKIVEMKLKEGDTVNAGDLIATVETSAKDVKPVSSESRPDKETQKTAKASKPEKSRASENVALEVLELRVPDLEGSTDVAVVEVYISAGDLLKIEAPVISLESDKAVMDVPSTVDGTVTEVRIKAGDTVNAGDIIALVKGTLTTSENRNKPEVGIESPAVEKSDGSAVSSAVTPDSSAAASATPVNQQKIGSKFHATPSVRSFARELGIDLGNIPGSGPKGRITREDVTSLVKKVFSGSPVQGSGIPSGFSLPPIPTADYAAFGEIETLPLSRIQKVSGPHLHRNWIGVPHVTQFEEADITDLEEFRKELNAENVKSGKAKISPLIFIIRAVAQALKDFPDFNSSLGSDAATLIRKKYINIGIAVDTPGGLMVPVIRDADRKGIQELAELLGDLSARARDGKLKSDEMKGGTFSISSLGGIGGTYFTPIVNAPEVAILGLSRSSMKPVWNGEGFKPRLILPFAVSYDHRVVDGAQGAHFAVHLSKIIGDMRRALL